jgi:hypothetical protein
MEILVVVAFVKPENMWSSPTSTARALQGGFGFVRERFALSYKLQFFRQKPTRLAALLVTARIIDIAVNLIRSLDAISSAKVKAIDILRDQKKTLSQAFLKLHHGTVACVGCGSPTNRASIEVPRPYRFGLRREHRMGRHLLGVVFLGPHCPIPLFASKGRDTALRRNTGARHDHKALPLLLETSEPIAEVTGERIVGLHGVLSYQ